MARTIHTHGPTGLRYTYDHTARLAVGEIQRTELVDHPGHIDRRYRGSTSSSQHFTAFCDECCQSAEFNNFTDAMKHLHIHIKRHEGAVIRETYVGFRVESERNGAREWIRARCTNGRCAWTGSLVLDMEEAEKQGARHFQSHLDRPTPACNRVPNPSKEQTMTKLSDVNARIAVHEARLVELQAERTRLEARPAEPIQSDVITFGITFPGNATRYEYAARRDKTRKLWWVTGREGGRGRTWEEMLDFMAQDKRVQEGKPIRFRTHLLVDGTLVKGEY